MEPVEIRGNRRGALVALAVGLAGLALAATVDFLRKPLVLLVVALALLAGLAALLDRRVKLVIGDRGVRWAEWGRVTVPWHEFSGYRWTAWRGQPYLQLVPRRPTELVASFSTVGKINQRSGRLVRMPPFAINASRLAASPDRLTELVAGHLPEQPAGIGDSSG